MRRAWALLILAAAPVAADEIFLKGGGHLRGVIVERTPTAIAIEVAPGRVTLPMSRVDRVALGSSALSSFRERAAKLPGDDLAGWLALAQWAQERDLRTQVQEAFDRVLALDPGNLTVHRALGHVHLDGRWMTESESYRARGLVQHRGAWMTPAEREALVRESEAAATAAGARAEAEARVREAEARARAAEAEARRAEAASRELDTQGGIPYPAIFLGGPCRFGCGHRVVRSHPRPAPPPTATPTPTATPRPDTPAPGTVHNRERRGPGSLPTSRRGAP